MDCPALSPKPLRISPQFIGGDYEGPTENPTRVISSDLFLGPADGGAYVAELSFTAVQVPEPSNTGLLTLGLAAIGLARFRGRDGGASVLSFNAGDEPKRMGFMASWSRYRKRPAW